MQRIGQYIVDIALKGETKLGEALWDAISKSKDKAEKENHRATHVFVDRQCNKDIR